MINRYSDRSALYHRNQKRGRRKCHGGEDREADVILNEPVRDGGSVEDAMASVNHVVVDGDHHHRWIKDDAVENTGVHCRVPLLGGFPFLLKLFEYLDWIYSD